MTIAAELANGKVVVGQCEISHPSSPQRPSTSPKTHKFRIGRREEDEESDEVDDIDEDWTTEDALVGEASSSVQNVSYTKASEAHQPLESPIRSV